MRNPDKVPLPPLPASKTKNVTVHLGPIDYEGGLLLACLPPGFLMFLKVDPAASRPIYQQRESSSMKIYHYFGL
jgi:hypothetical protein